MANDLSFYGIVFRIDLNTVDSTIQARVRVSWFNIQVNSLFDTEKYSLERHYTLFE